MNCEETQELLEAYALGLLEPESQAQVEAHLAGCESCRAQAAAYLETVAALTEALATVSPHVLPGHLRELVMAQATGRAPEVVGTGGGSPPLGDGVATAPPFSPVTANIWRSPVLRLRLALIAACLLLAIVLLWSLRLNIVLARERALLAEFSELVDQQEIVLEVIDSNETVRRVLLPLEDGSRAYGKVFTRAGMPHVVAMAARLPEPAPGEAYQLWLTRDGETFLAGALNVNEDGFGLLVFDDAVDNPQYDRVQVTLQPPGGSAPVEPPVLEWTPDRQ